MVQSTPKCVKRRLKKNIRENNVYMTISKPLVGEFLQYVKKQTIKVDKNAVAVVHSNSHCKEEVVGICPIALWTSLLLENASTMEVNTDWKSLQIFIFMDMEDHYIS